MKSQVQVWSFAPDECDQEGYEVLEFKLIYRGRLRAASVPDKHLLRKEFHKQLKYLWQLQEPFAGWMKRTVPAKNTPTRQEMALIDVMANQYSRCGYRFLPIVTEGRGLSCELDVLFLRRDPPGNLVKAGGDIDNRIKVLFDALRMPGNCTEVSNYPVGPDEDPFYVLLEDDSLITKISVTTDRLLLPQADGEHVNDVHLVIGVRVPVVKVSIAYALAADFGRTNHDTRTSCREGGGKMNLLNLIVLGHSDGEPFSIGDDVFVTCDDSDVSRVQAHLDQLLARAKEPKVYALGEEG